MRYISETLKEFAEEKIVLLSGPRQVGKTTLAKEWLSKQNGLYLNWDVAEEREQILSRKYLCSPDLENLVLDEFHKYGRWKGYLKGLYDKYIEQFKIVVTGSARLNFFRKGGESLFGRHELLRLHPFSVGECIHGKMLAPPEDWLEPEIKKSDAHLWSQLERRSGFPEPFFKDLDLHHRRWSRRRREQLIKEDLRDLSQIRDLSLVEQLMLLLPERVGSPLSINALREDLQVAHDTLSNWLDILDALYVSFRISPYFKKLNRSLKKEQKLYLWDWSQVSSPGSRFENMVASHLLKAVHAWTDHGYGDFNLHYWRDKQKNEVDFILTESSKPVAIFECKMTDDVPSKSLLYLSKTLKVPAIQLSSSGKIDKKSGNGRLIRADSYFSGFP